MKTFALSSLLLLALSAVACHNPADGKAKATVGDPSSPTPSASPTPATTPAPTPAAATAPAAASATTIALTPANTQLGFVGSKVTGSHNGSFGGFKGTVDLGDGKAEHAKVSFTIDMATVSTETEKLTGHLKSEDFFNVAKFPTATFTSTAIAAGGDKGASHTITGDLELHGVKKSISFPATVAISPTEVTVTSEFVINRKDFGIEYPGMKDDLIRDEVVIKIAIKAPRGA